MKTFRYSLGHLAGETATVKELIEFLQKYPYDMPVMATWEGVNAYIKPEETTIEPVSKGHKEDLCDCLILDVGEY